MQASNFSDIQYLFLRLQKFIFEINCTPGVSSLFLRAILQLHCIRAYLDFFHAPYNVLETYYFDLSLLLYILIHSFKYALTPPPPSSPKEDIIKLRSYILLGSKPSREGRGQCGGIECPAVWDFFQSLFFNALNVFESLKCMHIALNMVKINRFLYVYQHKSRYNLQMHLVAKNFGQVFLLMYFVLIINYIISF